MIDQLEIRLDASLDVGITELLGQTLLVNLPGYLLPELGQVVLGIGVLDVSEQIGASPHEIVSTPQQVPGGSHLGRIDICHWDHAASKQAGDLARVDLIVFSLPSVYRFHV